MRAPVLDLVTFISARLDEREAALPAPLPHEPAQVLREIQAMRIVVAELAILAGMSLGLGPETARRLLRVISGIWEDHPDYRPWLPVAVSEMPPPG